MKWQPIETAPENRKVLTKIHDGRGERNIAVLRRSGRMWFNPDSGMYMYYEPTHWAAIIRDLKDKPNG